ncbi:MT-A70-domain-containing protein [Suillus paluster]|uniref:MT-A70-domain-containing protein n=1 Tax=Suillus paluster TaxID=48578 RepID=UPI001B867E2A|nr:MT-A70-domain-containing protein [Suillus paluster]KAG1753775.1 MT-A70-domain-containing protein [Suillus paluster]
MSDDEFLLLVSTGLQTFLTSGRMSTPLTSMDFLLALISFRASTSASGLNIPRLTDLPRVERVLEAFSSNWEHGSIILSREGSELTIMDVHLGNSRVLEAINPRKRKRAPIDEDADSAAGSTPDEMSSSNGENECPMSTNTPLGSLSKDLKEVYAILQKSTAKGRLLAERFRSVNGGFEPICTYITKVECAKSRFEVDPSNPPNPTFCNLLHFRPLIRPHTDPSLGHCSYLNTCYSEPTYSQSPSITPFPPGTGARVSLPSGLGAGGRGKEKAPCRYLHFEIDWDEKDGTIAPADSWRTQRAKKPFRIEIGMGPDGRDMQVLPPQWINCDLRRFDYSVLGKFHVIMADPPWDIHMSLPYGTMTDDEMRAMPIPTLQDEGMLFLWVTGRAMEVGRECLRVWGYTRVDEVVWVKTNQLQRVIRTGRTGHWLNHTKEHMLVGVKTRTDAAGNLVFPSWANRGLDTDVIVSEVRETSRKPDEVYGLIERMCPGGRKIEIFGRKHNTRPGWLTLGNQLGQDQVYEEDLAARIKARYPERFMTVSSQAIHH